MKIQCIAALFGLLLAAQVMAKTIPNHAIADLVLGQRDFITGSASPVPSSFSSSGPSGIAIDPVSRKVFVSEIDGSRVLRYPNASALVNGAGAEAVFGQPRFSTNVSAGGDLGLSLPRSLFFDRMGRLWVADGSNNRVLMYEAAIYRDSQPYPDRVYGQPDFTTLTGGTTAAKMNSPQAVWIDNNDRLWVVEYSNNRVLRFDSISTKPSGAAADGVLGQVNFITGTQGSSSSGFQAPTGVAVSQTGTLFVSCNSGNRIMRFDNAASLGNGAGATAILGQPDFLTTTGDLSASKLNGPWGVWLTPDDSLWVCDYNNNRILRFDKASTMPNGAAATGVVGQPDFTTGLPNTTNRGLKTPYLLPYVDATGSLWVPDRGNNRVLRFPPDVTRPALTVTSTVPKSTTSKTLTVKGTASDTYGVTKVTYKVNTGSTKTATGTTSWQFKAALAVGNNTITINSVDSVGNKSSSKVLRIERK